MEELVHIFLVMDMLIDVLVELNGSGSRSMLEIGEKLGIGVSLLVHLLDDLERRNYVKKNEVYGGKCLHCTRACPFSGSGSVKITLWETTEKGKSLLRNRSQ